MCVPLCVFIIRLSANIVYYGGTLLTTSLFQHDEHCGQYFACIVLFDVVVCLFVYHNVAVFITMSVCLSLS